jgi:hypothetical protein
MSWRFWISGQLPSLNDIIAAAKGCGGKGFGYSTMKKKWTEHACWCALSVPHPKSRRVRLELLWVEPSSGGERDPDNIEAGQKFIWDGLKLAKVIPDDKAANNAGTRHRHDTGPRPGVWVTVIPCDGAPEEKCQNCGQELPFK